MKKIFSLLFACLSMTSMWGTTYNKVTSAPSDGDWSGDYLIVYSNTENDATTYYAWDGSFGLWGTCVELSNTEISNDKNTITSVAGSTFGEMTITAVTGGYTLQNADGDYCGATDKKFNSAATAVVFASIAMKNGFVAIQKVAGNNNPYRIVYNHNSGSGGIRVYKSTSTDGVLLYKKYIDPNAASSPAITKGTKFFTESYNVTITNNEAGGTVYYTTDGSTPTTGSASFTESSKVITVSATTTVQAMATATSKSNSDVVASTFTKVIVSSGGNGTKANPFVVADLDELGDLGTSNSYWVIGTICGTVKSATELNASDVNSNLALGTSSKFIPVELPSSGNIRKTLNVKDNPTHIGCDVLVYGNITSYFSTIGVKATSDYESLFVDITISAVGYATYYNADNAVKLPTGVTGYVMSYNTAKDHVNLVKWYDADNSVVPAGEPIVLGAEAGNYTLIYTTTAEEPLGEDNLLKGAATNMTAAEMAEANPGMSKFYALSLNAAGEASSVGFYWIKADGAAFDISAGKAYLALPADELAPARFVFGQQGVPTDMLNVNDNNQSTKVLRDGRLYIVRDGNLFDLNGRLVK